MSGAALRWVPLLGLVIGLLGACTSTDAPSSNGADIVGGTADDKGAGPGLDAAAMHPDASGEPVFDAGHDPNRNQIEPGHVCARLAAIECAGEALCCTHPGRSAVDCRKVFEQTCTGALLFDALSSAAAVGFDPALASVAFAELERRASLCDPQLAAWAASSDGFGASFTGSLGKSDDCEPDGGLAASSADLAVALASCQVNAGLACLPTAKAWTCVPRSSRAGVCFTDLNCAAGLFCDNPGSSFAGVCSERLASGQACTDATQCTSLMCKDGKCAAEDDVQAAYCL